MVHKMQKQFLGTKGVRERVRKPKALEKAHLGSGQHPKEKDTRGTKGSYILLLSKYK